MAQVNIDIAGAQYAEVPAIDVPKHAGGTARFTEVSDTTATAPDVMSGKYFYTAAGVRTQGTATQSQTYTEQPNAAGGNTAIITGGLEMTTGEAFNKAVYNNNTLIDLSSDTITADKVATGKTFHDANGVAGVGVLDMSAMLSATASRSSNTTISFAVEREPTFFVMYSNWIGSNTMVTNRTVFALMHAQTTTQMLAFLYISSSKISIYTYTSGLSWAYNNGTLTLTITASNLQFDSQQFKLNYY